MATGMDTVKQDTIMELAGKVEGMAGNLDDQMAEFLEGGARTTALESKPQPVLSPLNGIAERLEIAIRRLESAEQQFHQITNRIM